MTMESGVIRAVPTLLLVACISGCVAMTPKEIQATTPEVYESSASVDSAIRCMRTNAADFVQVTTYPETGSVDFTVETFQMLKTRILYMATLESLGAGSRVSARYSGQNSLSLSESEFRALLKTCAPPRTS